MINQRLRTKVIIALLTIATLSTLVIYGLPIVLKSKIIAMIQQETGRKTSLDKVQFALSPLSVQLQKIAIQDPNSAPFASIDNFYIKINIWQSLKQSALIIDKLTIKKPIIRLVKQKNGKFNFDDLFKNQPQNSSFFPVEIADLSLLDGKLLWETPSNKGTIQPINLTVTNLSTSENKKCELNLQLTHESSGQLHWQGEVSFNPLHSKGHVTINNLKLQLLTLALPTSASFNLQGYELLDTDYQVSYHKKTLTLSTTKTKIELRDFQYSEKNQNAIVVKAAKFTQQSDLKMTYVNNDWSLIADKAKFNLHDFEFSEPKPNKVLLKVPNFTQETDLKIDYKHDDWLFMLKQSKISASQIQFSSSDANKLVIKSGTLNNESDFKAQSTKQNWKLSANKLKINTQNLELDYSNTILKTPKIVLETSLNSDFTNNTQVTTNQGKLNSQHIQLFEKKQIKPLVAIADLAVSGVDFNLNKQELTINAMAGDGADFLIGLDSKGRFNYPSLFTSDKPETKANSTITKSTPSWAIKINQIALTHSNTTFDDKSQQKPVTITLNPIDFKLTGYNNKTNAKLPFQLNAVVNKTGSIQLTGDTVIDPFSAQLGITAKSIELEPFQPYFEKFARLDIVEGQFAAKGKMTFTIPENQPLDLKFTGDSNITELITRDQKRHRDFIKWKSLNLKSISVDLRKDSYTADSLVINQPYVRFTIKKDKSINFSDVFITDSQPANKTSTKTSIQPTQTFFKLNKVQVIDGSSDFADRSLILPFTAPIKSLDGGASDICSDKKSTMRISLKGNVYDLAPVDVDGHINLYSGNHDLTINFTGMPMPLISPYMVEFAGYKVEKGKMSLKLKYKIVDGELTASNNILIDQFELGEKVENPKAVSLPLEMAVALLKDSDGKINIDVPITGSLNDPQFSIGAIISDALVNAISKVVTSPFQALASLLGDDEENISTISFKAGNAILDKAEQDKLATLAKLLKERSVLILDIKGAAFLAQDWPAMKDAALYDSFKQIRADEINRQIGSRKTLATDVELSEADYKRLLAEQFIAKFPKLARKSFFGNPELIDPNAGNFYEVAKQNLNSTLKGEQTRLKTLAGQRAQAIARYLVQKAGVSNDQVFILDPVVDPKRDNKEITSILSLKAK